MSINIDELLKKAVKLGASDVHVKVGNAPIIRINGELSFMPGEKRLSSEDSMNMAYTVMSAPQKEAFKKRNDLDIAYSVPGLGRFRCNAFVQRGTIGMVFRIIPMKILDTDQLHLPPIVRTISLEPRGLILVTGTTGSGKTTTLAAMVDYINSNRTDHVMTIEDPIEFLHRDKRSIVNQREVGTDTESFSRALRAAMRQDPDVILVGEMRDFETIQTALIAAETGHLVLSTLHTVDSAETINRIISVFPPYQHKQVRVQLASVLRAIISMRLTPMADGKGRVPAVEILRATATIKGCIEDPDKTKLIPDVIAQSYSQYQMQTFDQSLMQLYKDELITYEDALRRATNPDDFILKVKGVQSTSDLQTEADESIKNKQEPEIERFNR
ncbi:twitching mobility protein [bacterium BMS3Abin10]|nr:twitching mobility protein [bacterium BMS3Abin10]GBE37669.1 twitching mobility protein [bacterium BMS3Bbin08]